MPHATKFAIGPAREFAFGNATAEPPGCFRWIVVILMGICGRLGKIDKLDRFHFAPRCYFGDNSTLLKTFTFVDSLVETIAMTGVEDTGDLAMLELFRAELDSHLPVLSEGLLALEKNGDQPKWFEAMMRAAHSIKGAARIVGVEGAVRVAHVLEDCFVAAQQRDIRLGPGAVDVLLRGVDVLGSFSQASAPPLTAEVLSEVADAIAALRRQPEPNLAPPTGPVLVQLPDLVAAGPEQLRQQLVGHRQRGATSYCLDFAHVREIEPAALTVLALFARWPCRDGSAPRIEAAHARPEVYRVLHLTGLDTSWTVRPEQERRA